MTTASSDLPVFLRERVRFTDHSSTLQDIQVGAQMVAQQNQQRIQQRQLAMQEEAHRLKMEGQRFVSTGAIALGRLMEEGGNNNLYADSAFEGKLWSLGQRYPQLLESEVFQGAVKVIDHAKAAKLKAEVTDVTQQAITARNDASIQSRFDLLSQRLDGMLQMEGVRQDGRTAIEELRGDLRILRDSLKPTRTGELVHDLPETDLVAMRSELGALDKMYEHGGIKKDGKLTKEQVYQNMRQQILKTYDAKRIGTPKPADTTATVPPAEQRQVGAVYQTPKGPFKWNGTGWEAP